MKFTNISAGLVGLNTKTGTVLVDPRRSVDVEIEAAEKRIALDTGWFVEGGSPRRAKSPMSASLRFGSGGRARHHDHRPQQGRDRPRSDHRRP